MDTQTVTTKSRKAAAPSASTITRRMDPAARAKLLGAELPKPPPAQPAGDYRVIHGSVILPRPREERLLPDGTINEYVPSFVTAEIGDEVRLSEQDATQLMHLDVVEPVAIDKRNSRLGKVAEENMPKGRTINHQRPGVVDARETVSGR